MDEEEFDEINKKLSRRQRRMLILLTRVGDAALPLKERLRKVEERHNHLVDSGIIGKGLLDGEIEDLVALRNEIHHKIREEARLKEAAHKAVFGTKRDVLHKDKKKKKPKYDHMYG